VATTECTPDVFVPLAEVEGSKSSSSWSVAEYGWKQLLPDLPDDVIALLATPVVVSTESLSATDSSSPAVPEATGAKAARPVIDDCTPRFLAPPPPEPARPPRRAR